MNVNTTRFGVIEVADTSTVKMPRGPLGFEPQTGFCLIQHRPDTNFRWLQSTEEPSLAFVVIDPSDYFMGYDIEIPDADAEKLELSDAEDALLLVIVTIKSEGKEITANLAAPIIVNTKNNTALQVVLNDPRYGVKHPLIEGNVGTNNSEKQQEDGTEEAKCAKVQAA